MAYNVAALTNFTKDKCEDLIVASIFDAKTQKLIQDNGLVMPNVKSSENLTQMETDAVFQTGGTCGFNSQGTTTFTARTVTVGKIKVNEALCPKSLETKALQQKLKAGSRPDSMPFEEEYSFRKAAVIAKQLEIAIWQGDTASGNANLNKFDGFLKVIETAAAFVDANTAALQGAAITVAGGGVTDANVRGIVKGCVKAVPADLKGKDDFVFLVGMDFFETWVLAMIEANLFHIDVKDKTVAAGELTIPGTVYRLIGVPGLNGTSRVVGIRLSNMVLACDILGEEDKFEIFFAKEADEVRFIAEWKTGVQVNLPAEIVYFKLK